jgi:hypothetical protein
MAIGIGEIQKARKIFTSSKTSPDTAKSKLLKELERIVASRKYRETIALLGACPRGIDSIELLTGETDGHWFKYFLDGNGLRVHAGFRDTGKFQEASLDDLAESLIREYNTPEDAIRGVNEKVDSRLKEIVAVADNMAGKTP